MEHSCSSKTMHMRIVMDSSSIKYSQLVKLWNVQSQDISRLNEDTLAFCIHEHHDVLEPFFQTNCVLKV